MSSSHFPDASNTKESMWPSIPSSLLRMIEDKLDIIDDTRLSGVCRDWRLASISYLREQSLAKGVPFLMQTSEEAIGMINECNKHQLPDASNTTESMWASIPDSLLWTIKDKLNIYDNTCLSAVCHDWWLGSASYCPSRDQSLRTGFPFLTHAIRHYEQTGNKEAECARQEFICVATKRKFSTNFPQFETHSILYSKKGWLLLVQQKPSGYQLGVLLMNPIRGVEILLPSVLHDAASQDHSFGSFSIDHEGYPDCVVLLEFRKDYYYEGVNIVIKTAYPRDHRWTTITCLRNCNFRMNSVRSFMTVGQHAYISTSHGVTFVCNMDTKVWNLVSPSPAIFVQIPGNCFKYSTEFEGQVVEISINRWLDEFKFFRFNFTTTSWEVLSSIDIKDTNWFLVDTNSDHCGRFCFGTRGKGVKVYHIRRHINHEDGFSRGDYRVVCYDLMDGCREISLPNFRANTESVWVDI